LKDGCSYYSFGRRKTNNFYVEDEHLSGIHAKIFIQKGEFVIEDMHSTNGYF
jgi:pSer/pThr/pTyr-binding forkhead associated (FHA) protein